MFRWFVATLLACLFLAAPVQAREEIDRFISDMVVLADGTLDVVEDISVNAEGNQIRRGIFRDFPTDYKQPNGTRIRVGFEVTSVKRNGMPEAWTTEKLSNGVRVRIGSADRFLAEGIHTYTITYKTTRQIGFFEDHDELYWNVTGNGWQFPINEVQASVTLPTGAKIREVQTYTGRQGSTANQAVIRKREGSVFQASTTAPLSEEEGFTIAVAWQKGIVAPPTSAQKMQWFIEDNLGYGILAATLLGVTSYFWLAWARVGRDPPGGPIVPLFYPPEGLGPAALRYIRNQSFDNQALSAALVGLAVKGRLKIENDDGDFVITRTEAKPVALSVSETALLNALPQSQLKLEDENHSKVSRARSALSQSLEEEYNGTMFLRNFRWFALGAALSVIGLIASGAMMANEKGPFLMFGGIFSAIWWGALLPIAYGTASGMWSGGFLRAIGRMMRLLFLVPFMAAGIIAPAYAFFSSGLDMSMLSLFSMALILGLVNFVFYKLLPAPTPAGRRTLDQIEGFRMYLATAEEKRLDALHPPEKTPELFERYLPYAMALDCENEWNKKFTAVLAAAAAAGATAPIWYSSNRNGWSSGGFASGLNSALSSSISSASTPPGSSSGMSGGSSGGGGGSSGGGGGGGGGGGW